MKTISDLVNSIASAGGIENKDSVKALLANAELSKIEIPSELTDVYQNNFMTLESAKANAELNKFFKSKTYSETLDPIDKKLESGMSALGFSDDQIQQVKKEDSTYKRIDKYNEIARGITSSATSTTDKQKFKDAIDKLNLELSGKDKGHEEKINAINAMWTAKFSTKSLREKFLEKPLYTSDVQTIEDTLLLAESKLNRYLSEKKASLSYDANSDTFKIVQADNKELPYTENHQEVSFNTIRDKVLADSKLLKVTTTSTTQNRGATQHQTGNGNEPEPSLKDIQFNKNAQSDLENLTSAAPVA